MATKTAPRETKVDAPVKTSPLPRAASVATPKVVKPAARKITKPPAYERQGVTLDDLIDFTPELKAEATRPSAGLVLKAGGAPAFIAPGTPIAPTSSPSR